MTERNQGTSSTVRVLIALPGLHRVTRGAEVAFESLGVELARLDGCDVTLLGSGEDLPERPYRYLRASCVPRERFERMPHIPVLRDEYTYEELSFVPGLRRAYDPGEYDVTVTCSYPFTNWTLRARGARGRRPAHVYVTQNGDWPAQSRDSEYRFFRCDGLVCTNPEYFERNRDRWRSVLIPNGVDDDVFRPADPADRDGCRDALGLPRDVPVVVMVSALIPSKRVLEGVRSVAATPNLHLVVAGDGPLRDELRTLGRGLLGERFRHVLLPRAEMPSLYRAADAFLHMSLDEPSANAYIEALASGLPIVTHDREVTRWTLEDTSVLVDTEVESDVVEGLRRALGARSAADVARRRELVARRFTWRHLATEYLAFFRDVLGARER